MDSDLLAYLVFDGNAEDVSGNGYDGIVTGALQASDRYGNPLGAYRFDGDDYIAIPNAEGLKGGGFPLSVAVWFNAASISGDKSLVTKYLSSTWKD